MSSSRRVPVTVLTGFLGSGKTTLLNRILSEHHGKRIAVIENEFGEVGVDQALVIGAEEELFETNNGCICCTVRGDLIRILGQLMRRRDKFDYVLIETTGLADPGPVAQTFFLDDELGEQFVLDAIVTVVDAAHFEQQIERSREAAEQVAFADVVLLNKIDLVPAAAAARIEARIRGINGTARITRTQNAAVPIADILDLGAFDLDRALSVDGSFLEPQYPFEWAGAYALPAGRHVLRAGEVHGDDHHHHHHHTHDHHDGPRDDHHDHGAHAHEGHAHEGHAHAHTGGLAAVLLPIARPDDATLQEAIEAAVRAFAEPSTQVDCGGVILPDARPRVIDVAHQGAVVALEIEREGAYALFLEHAPEEFALSVEGREPAAFRRFASHHHDDEIASIGIEDSRELDQKKLNDWLAYLLQSRGADIYRMKGVLSVRGEERRYVFHGVHMMFDGRFEKPWKDRARRNQLVFIGRNLDRNELEAGFESCVA